MTWLFGSRGIPPSYRHMDGFSSLTHQWLNANNEVFRVKYHCKTDQGIECMTVEDAIRIAGRRYHRRDLMHAIGRAEFPSWTLKMQIMPAAEAANYHFSPFDLTKVWPCKDYPLIPIGEMVLNRNPENYFAAVEQAASSAAIFAPGMVRRPRRCCKGGYSPTATPIAIASARMTLNCR